MESRFYHFEVTVVYDPDGSLIVEAVMDHKPYNWPYWDPQPVVLAHAILQKPEEVCYSVRHCNDNSICSY